MLQIQRLKTHCKSHCKSALKLQVSFCQDPW